MYVLVGLDTVSHENWKMVMGCQNGVLMRWKYRTVHETHNPILVSARIWLH